MVYKIAAAAHAHLHDLDWLQGCELVSLPEVQERINPRHTMPEARALRSLIVEAAPQVVPGIGDVPDMVSMKVLLERYLQGKKMAEVAEELGVSHRENYV